MTDISSEQIKALLSKPETLERIASMVESFGGGGLSQVLAGNAPESRKPEIDVQPQNEAQNTVLPASAGTHSERTARKGHARQAHHASKSHPPVCQRCKKRARGRIGTRVECGGIVEQL